MLSKILNYIGIFLMAVVILLVLPLTLPKLFGIHIFGVLTGSMEPEYPTGCAVYVKEVDFEEINIGDPITYRLGTDTELVATHRVVEIESEQQMPISPQMLMRFLILRWWEKWYLRYRCWEGFLHVCIQKQECLPAEEFLQQPWFFGCWQIR